MRKSKMWRMMTVAAVAASMTCGVFGVQSVSADDKKTLKVAMECGYAPYNWTQPDDSNGAVQISGLDLNVSQLKSQAKDLYDKLGGSQGIFDKIAAFFQSIFSWLSNLFS